VSVPLDRGLLATCLRPHLRRVVLLAILVFGGIALQLINPLIAGSFLDRARTGRPFASLIGLAIGFTVVALAAQVSMVAETYVAVDLGWRTTNALRVDLTRRVLGLDVSFHAMHPPGELVERVDGDVSAITNFFSRFIVYVFGNVVFLLGVVGVLLAIDWRIGTLMALFAVLALVVMTKGGGFVARRSRRSRVAVGALSGFLEERLGGLPDIKACGADGWALVELHEHMDERYQATRSSALAGSGFSAGVSTLFVLGTGAALALGAALVRSGTVTPGTVFVVFRYAAMLRYPLEQLSRQMAGLQQAAGGLARVRDLLDTEPAIIDGPGAAFPDDRQLSVELENVTFAYGTEPVLRDVSLRVEAGEVLGLLGRTGSGKTTITRLLFRLHDVSAGAIRIGGVDVREGRLDELRSRIGLVTQEVQLFEGTLRDNVTMIDPTVTDERVLEVLSDLGLDPWLARLPDGLDTILGRGGSGLSAGEGQLVALARVFLADPCVVVMDEPSSRLDPATERLLDHALRRLLEGRTAIIVAHRLTTVDRADRVVVLEQGQIVEAGQRVDLAADPESNFSRLRRIGMTEVRP
jgi:ATP-binding cassette subfamily B protein